jgi:hypothetical protein
MQSSTTKEMLQTVLRARKSRKFSSSGDAVSSLELEAALLEGRLFSLYLPGRCLTPCVYRARKISA